MPPVSWKFSSEVRGLNVNVFVGRRFFVLSSNLNGMSNSF